MSEEKWVLELTSEQVNVIAQSLDLTSRLLCGNVEEIIPFIAKHIPKTINKTPRAIRYAKDIKLTLFPDLPLDAGHGILSDKVPKEAKISYDIECVIKHALSWHRNPEGGWLVDFDDPINASGQELPIMKIKE